MSFIMMQMYIDMHSVNLVNMHKLWKILKVMRISQHLTCLLRNQYVDQQATVRTMNWLHIEQWTG